MSCRLVNPPKAIRHLDWALAPFLGIRVSPQAEILGQEALSEEMLASIVVSAFNQRDLLKQMISSLSRQTIAAMDYEVVVADDGSTDGTGEMLRSLQAPFHIEYHWQRNSGRASVRNLGIRHAKGDVLVFLDGDMVAHDTLVAEHLQTHAQYPDCMVIGRVKLASTVPDTPLTQLVLAPGGDFTDALDEQGLVRPTACATGNLSIKRQHLERIGLFDEDFHAYGWEDVEFGVRAARAGIRIVYNPRAIAYHQDYVTNLDQHCRRVEVSARSAVILFQKYPELLGQMDMFRDKIPVKWGHDPTRLVIRKLLRQVGSAWPFYHTLRGLTALAERVFPSPVILNPLYRWVIGNTIYRGYRHGLQAPRHSNVKVSG